MTTTNPGRAGDPTAEARALNWSERQAVDELVGALVSVAGLIAHRPDTAKQVWATVIDQLGEAERKLVTALEWEMVRRNVAEMKAEGSFPVAASSETESLEQLPPLETSPDWGGVPRIRMGGDRAIGEDPNG